MVETGGITILVGLVLMGLQILNCFVVHAQDSMRFEGEHENVFFPLFHHVRNNLIAIPTAGLVLYGLVGSELSKDMLFWCFLLFVVHIGLSLIVWDILMLGTTAFIISYAYLLVCIYFMVGMVVKKLPTKEPRKMLMKICMMLVGLLMVADIFIEQIFLPMYYSTTSVGMQLFWRVGVLCIIKYMYIHVFMKQASVLSEHIPVGEGVVKKKKKVQF